MPHASSQVTLLSQSFLLKAVVCPITKDHSLSLRSMFGDPRCPLSLSRTYSSSLGQSLAPRSGLASLLCSQLTLNTSPFKTAHPGPTEKAPRRQYRATPLTTLMAVCTISFGARLLCTRSKSRWVYLLSDSLQCLEARHEARIYSPSLHSA